MKSPQNLDTDASSNPIAQQHFVVPHCAPFLEVRTTLDSTLPYAEHIHSAFSFGLILQGKTRFTLNGTEYRAQEGDTVLIAAGQTHSCNPIDGPRGYHMLLIDMDWLREHIADDLSTCAPLIRDTALFPKAAAIVEAILANQDNAASLLTDLLLKLQAQYEETSQQNNQPILPWPGLNPPDDANSTDSAPVSVSVLAKASGSGFSPFETKHGVKGAEFENVLVIVGRGWNRYNFGEMLELAALPQVPPKKQEAFERNRNLFYVVCSRPKRRLALLFTQKLSESALSTVARWFGQENVINFEFE